MSTESELRDNIPCAVAGAAATAAPAAAVQAPAAIEKRDETSILAFLETPQGEIPSNTSVVQELRSTANILRFLKLIVINESINPKILELVEELPGREIRALSDLMIDAAAKNSQINEILLSLATTLATEQLSPHESEIVGSLLGLNTFARVTELKQKAAAVAEIEAKRAAEAKKDAEFRAMFDEVLREGKFTQYTPPTREASPTDTAAPADEKLMDTMGNLHDEDAA